MAIDTSWFNEIDRKVFDWVGANIGADVRSFERQRRWRLGWDVVVDRDGMEIPFYVRGSKGDNYVCPTDLRQEAGIQRIFERYGIPAPRVLGFIDDPEALVLSRLPGRINTATIDDPVVRQRIRDEFTGLVARVHRIPLAEFEPLGMTIPRDVRENVYGLYAPSEAIFDRSIGRPFPLMSFLAAWLKRNIPMHRDRSAFINTDAGQFLFDDEHVTGLIDFETSMIGDPAAELAGMRLRDTSEPLGDLALMMDRYEQLTGDRIEKSVIEYHTAGFCAVNGWLMWPMLFNPVPGQDYISWLNFSVATSRWAITAVSEFIGLKLEAPREPVARPLPLSPAAAHLAGSIAGLKAGSPVEEYARDSAAALGRYIQRWHDYGLDILEQDLADAKALTGLAHADWEEAQAALDDWLETAGPEHDRQLTQHFHNWLHRQDFLLRGCGYAAYNCGLDLQPIPPR
jgi:aminoglycoside phosphotransferase (APT) family kinase protein